MSTLTEALAPKSDQLNADDLIPGPRTITITGAKISKADRQTRITLSFEGDNGKPFKPCKTMGRAMVMVWGITDDNYEEQFIGKSIRVYRDPDVKFGDQGAVGGIRISHMSHIEKATTVKLTVSQGKKANFVFQPLPRSVQQTPTDPAEKWATGYIAAVNKAATAEELNKFANDKAGKLAELQSKRPDLHRSCVYNLDAQRAKFAPATSEWDDDFSEGKPDEATGEAFTDEANDTIAEVESLADQFRAEIAAAEDLATLGDIQNRFGEAKERLSGNDITSIRTAIAERRKKLTEGDDQ